jgi:hypothetical protein
MEDPFAQCIETEDLIKFSETEEALVRGSAVACHSITSYRRAIYNALEPVPEHVLEVVEDLVAGWSCDIPIEQECTLQPTEAEDALDVDAHGDNKTSAVFTPECALPPAQCLCFADDVPIETPSHTCEDQRSDEGSDMRNPHSEEIWKSEVPGVMSWDELELKQKLIELLSNEERNPHKGSMPLERVQNILSSEAYADLYDRAVGKGKGRLREFLNRHSDITVFGLEDGKKWRVRLTSNVHYAEGDERESQAAKEKEDYIVGELEGFLAEVRTCDVDAFIAHYQNGDARKYVLPNRGDLVRLVLKHSKPPNPRFNVEKIPKTETSPPTCYIKLGEETAEAQACPNSESLGAGIVRSGSNRP